MTRLSRSIGFVAIASVVLLSGLQQLASTALLAPYATRVSFPRLVPEAVGVALSETVARLPLPSPLTVTLRIAAARRLLAEGRFAAAGLLIAPLPPSDDRSDLLGITAAGRGESASAADDFIAAGDAERLAPIVDAYAKNDIRRALAIEGRMIARLARERVPSPDLADAYWELGVLRATLGYVGTPAERTSANAASTAAYAHAVRLAPMSVKYLLSLANQQANTGARGAAIATFRRIVALDPRGADARAGLARLGAQEP